MPQQPYTAPRTTVTRSRANTAPSSMRSPHKHRLGNLAIHLSEEDLFDAGVEMYSLKECSFTGAGDSSATAGLFKTGVVSAAFPDVVGAVGVLQPPAKSRTTKKGKRGNRGRRRKGGDVRQAQARILLSSPCHLHPLLSHNMSPLRRSHSADPYHCRHRLVLALTFNGGRYRTGGRDVRHVQCKNSSVDVMPSPSPSLPRTSRAESLAPRAPVPLSPSSSEISLGTRLRRSVLPSSAISEGHRDGPVPFRKVKFVRMLT